MSRIDVAPKSGAGHPEVALAVIPETKAPAKPSAVAPAPAPAPAAAARNGNGHGKANANANAAAHAGAGGGEEDEHATDAAAVAEANAIVAAADLERGLTDAAVAAKRAVTGFNETLTVQEPAALVFAKKFWGLSPWMLELVIIISGVLRKWADFGVVTFLLFFNAALAFREDMKARAAVEALKQKLQLTARVLRNSAWLTLPARELVPGDVIRLRMGDLVPADARVVTGACGVDQSALTGESTVLDRPTGGLLFSASLLRRGEVTAVVTAIGGRTFFGKTAKLVDDSNPATHIDAVVSGVTKGLMTLVVAAVIVAVVVVAAKDTDQLVDALSLMLVVLVTAIPVALPAMYTTAMALGSHELVAEGVVVTRLGASEDAASMTVLCSDKTGTLTRNEMTVREVRLVTGCSDSKQYALQLGVLASKLENHDPVDVALFNAFRARSFADTPAPGGSHALEHEPAAAGRQQPGAAPGAADAAAALQGPGGYRYREVHFVPFDAAIRRTEVVLAVSDANGKVLGTMRVMKGAVATLCELAQMPAAAVAELNAATAEHGAKGWRSMAIAVSDIVPLSDAKSEEKGDASAAATATADGVKHTGLKVLGVIGMSDEARADSKDVCAELARLGIAVKMLTGDNHKVARAMAAEVGLAPNIINLDAEKRRIRDLLQSGHQSMPRKIGQRRPSNMLKTGAHKVAATPTHALSNQLQVVPGMSASAIAELHVDAPVIAIDAPMAGPKAEGTGVGAGVGPSTGAPVRVTDEMVQEELRHTMDFINAAGFAQIFPADKHMIVKALQDSGAIVGMTGDGVNDAPALKQAEVGCAVSNATDVAKGAASAVLTNDGLSGVVHLVKSGRRIHHRIETWILNKTCRTLATTAFVVISYLINGHFVVTAFSMLLMLFLFDFVTITIATDNVRDIAYPTMWRVRNYMAAAAILGVLVGIEDFGLLYMGVYGFGLNSDEQNTLGFQLIMYYSLLTTLIVRERRRFWHSFPGTLMTFFISLEIVVIYVVCSIGIPGMTGLPWLFNLLALGCVLVAVFGINDAVKCFVFERLAVGTPVASHHAEAHFAAMRQHAAAVATGTLRGTPNTTPRLKPAAGGSVLPIMKLAPASRTGGDVTVSVQ